MWVTRVCRWLGPRVPGLDEAQSVFTRPHAWEAWKSVVSHAALVKLAVKCDGKRTRPLPALGRILKRGWVRRLWVAVQVMLGYVSLGVSYGLGGGWVDRSTQPH